jgi:phosphoglycolate phosphatase
MAPALIFDLDGTLVDTAPDLLAALNHALALEGRPPVNPANLRQLVGHGARVMIAEAFKTAIGPTDPEMAERMLKTFLAFYRDHIADQSRPWAGVVETLEVLKAQGAHMGVLTNKPHDLSVLLLQKLKLDGYFASVFGQGRVPYMKPDPRIFADVVRDCGATSGLMIGDSETDVETARAAGAPVILVSFGYTTMPARELGADAVVDHFSEIPEAIARLSDGALDG